MAERYEADHHHPHRDVIIAWANGATIQVREEGYTDWITCKTRPPLWKEGYEYRVKAEKTNEEIIAEMRKELIQLRTQVRKCEVRLDSIMFKLI